MCSLAVRIHRERHDAAGTVCRTLAVQFASLDFAVVDSAALSTVASPGVVYLCLSFSSDEHHRSHSFLGTGMRVEI